MKRTSSKDSTNLKLQLDKVSLMHCKKHLENLRRNIPEERITSKILRTILFYCQEKKIEDLSDLKVKNFKEIIVRLNKKGIENPSDIKERTALMKNIKRMNFFVNPYSDIELTPELLGIVKEYEVICPHCNTRATLTPSIVISKKSEGNIYLCGNCGAYCGTHDETNIPKGLPANNEERRYRKYAHNEFDKLWKKCGWNRLDAYTWLAYKMKLSIDETHIGLFSVKQCKKVLAIVYSYSDKQKAI